MKSILLPHPEFRRVCAVYRIPNFITKRFYIGSSWDVGARRTVHIRRLNNGVYGERLFQIEWDTHGGENFGLEILEECPKETLRKREEFWIEQEKAIDNGYNIYKDGSYGGGSKRTTKQKEAQSKRMKEVRNRPELKKLVSDRLIELYKDPQNREITADQTRETWTIPEIREKRINGMLEAFSDQGFLDQKSETMKNLWQTQEYRDALMESRNDPTFKENMADKLRKLWADPVYREYMMRKRREARERKNGENPIS